MNMHHQSGLTLLELLLAMVLGLVVLGGSIVVFGSTTVSSRGTLDQIKLNQQLAALMSVMTDDIRRAGYWGNQTVANFTDPTTSPFHQMDNTQLEVHAANVQVAANSNVGGECVVYTYDMDDDGLLDDAEIVGFRLNGAVAQMRINGDIANNARHDSCNDADDNWANLTDPSIVSVDVLNFGLGSSACLNAREPDLVDNDGVNGVDDAAEADCYDQVPAVDSGDVTVETRQVTIVLTGSLVSDPTVRATLTQDVRVRNDLIKVR